MKLGEKLRFALESRETLLVLGERCRQDLDRHLALELGVGGAIDLAHAALAELGGDLVGAEALADHRWRRGRQRHRTADYTGRRPGRYAVAPPADLRDASSCGAAQDLQTPGGRRTCPEER